MEIKSEEHQVAFFVECDSHREVPELDTRLRGLAVHRVALGTAPHRPKYAVHYTVPRSQADSFRQRLAEAQAALNPKPSNIAVLAAHQPEVSRDESGCDRQAA